MQLENLILQFENAILTITIHRPKAMNALNQPVLKELRYVFSTFIHELEGLRGIILTGSGEKAFVAGADISEFTSLDADAGTSLSKNGSDIFTLIERTHVPVIAAVNGFALGGGCELAMACHMRIASENARFGQPEVNLGIIPGYGGTQRLVQYIGKTKATELILTGDMLTAAQAETLGLVNYTVPAAELLNKCHEVLNKIKTKAPIAIAKSIECINAYFDKSINGFDFEVAAFGETVSTDDFKEGASAFLEKRKPVFKGK